MWTIVAVICRLILKLSMNEQILLRIEQLLKEHLKWAKFASQFQLKKVLESALKEEEKKIYELSNGQRSTRDIEKLTSASRGKIAALWKKWYKMVIVESLDKYNGTRVKRLSSLSDLGIAIKMPTDRQSVQQSEEDIE